MPLMRAFSKARAVRQRIRRLGGFAIVSRHIAGILRREGWRSVLVRIRRHLSISTGRNGPPQLPGGRVWPLAGIDTPLFDGRIAVMLHAYYPDLLEEIRTSLALMPQAYVLLVSTVSDEAAAEVRRVFANLPHLQRLEVKVLPNRGRDIAPLLAGFADELRTADLICHIHTKKSLYTSTEQVGWRRHIFSHIFPSTVALRQLFGLFTKEPALGIIYPRQWEAFPYWAQTWLSNKHAGRALVERLGGRFDSSAYIDFPAGSMFWARREALAPLLDLNLRYEDFPDEQGQTDGCLHHAVERCLVLSARLAGFNSAVVDVTEGCVRERDDKNLHHYLYAPLSKRLRDMIGLAEILSLDIFDTLVQRPFADPDRMFDYLTDKLAAEGVMEDFVGRRKGAETRARQRLGREVGLPDIYAEMRRDGVPPEVCEHLEALEVATEKRMLAPRPAMLAALSEISPQLPRILVSDMYLTEPVLHELMAGVGVSGYAALWVSNSLDRRKDTGTMWHHMSEESALTKGRQILHVGDNEHSDIQLPLDARAAQTCHVMRATSLFSLSLEGTALARCLKRTRWQDDLLFGMLARRASHVMDVHPQTFADRSYFAAPEDFGYALFGPLLFHYLGWVIERARADGCTDLLYVAREGYLFSRLHEKLAAHSSDLPRGHYFLCSRQSTGMPSLRRLDDLRALARSRFHGTLAEFVSVRLDPRLMSLPGLSAVAHKKLLLPNDVETLIDIFATEETAVLTMAEEARTLYRRYVSDLTNVTGLVDERNGGGRSRTALVDVGYSGSTQRNLQQAQGTGLQGYYMVTHNDVRAVEELGGRATACFASGLENTSEYPLFRHSLVLEALLTAPHGQVRRILPNLGFEYAPLTLDEKTLACLEAAHRGVENFFDDVLNAFGADWPMIRFDQEQLVALFESFVNGELAAGEVLRQMHVEDYFGGNGMLGLVEFYGLADARGDYRDYRTTPRPL